MRFLNLLFLVVIFNSCSEATNTSVAEQENEVAPDSLVAPVIQEADSPGGWKLGERFASDDNVYVFCPDGTVEFDNNFGTRLDGTWELINDTIYIDYSRRITLVGIGEPLPPPPVMPGNYMPQYEDYEELIEKTDEQNQLCWSEIKSFLDKDSTYPYEIVSRGNTCK